MGKFDGKVIVSDMDGTLLADVRTIPKANIDAINYFIENGGHFTVATGRSNMSIASFPGMPQLNFPAIVDNGAVIYDFVKRRVVFAASCSDKLKEAAIAAQQRFPDSACYVFTSDAMYTPVICEFNDVVERIECSKSILCPFSEMPDSWIKCVYYARTERINEIHDFVEKLHDDTFETVISDPRIYELLPKSANKGTALDRLAEITGYSISDMYGMGDYYNDCELLEHAGVAAVPANAPDDIKAMADILLCDHKEGAVADLIGHIERSL